MHKRVERKQHDQLGTLIGWGNFSVKRRYGEQNMNWNEYLIDSKLHRKIQLKDDMYNIHILNYQHYPEHSGFSIIDNMLYYQGTYNIVKDSLREVYPDLSLKELYFEEYIGEYFNNPQTLKKEYILLRGIIKYPFPQYIFQKYREWHFPLLICNKGMILELFYARFHKLECKGDGIHFEVISQFEFTGQDSLYSKRFIRKFIVKEKGKDIIITESDGTFHDTLGRIYLSFNDRYYFYDSTRVYHNQSDWILDERYRLLY